MIDLIQATTISKTYRASRWRMASYYLSRLIVSTPIRRLIIAAIERWIGRDARKNNIGSAQSDVLSTEGILLLNQSISELQCHDIESYLSGKPIHDRNQTLKKKVSDIQPGEMSVGFYDTEDILNCPHIMEFVSSPEIIQLAADHLGCRPTLSGIVVQWSFPTNNPGVTQKFHRDREDWKFLRFFIYLSDVAEGCGPHVFIRGSHRDRLSLRLKFYTAEEVLNQYGVNNHIKVYGKRGTGIAVDTCGIHRGEPPTINPRLMLSFTYSMFPNPFFRYKPTYTRHSPEMKNYSNRLFLR